MYDKKLTRIAIDYILYFRVVQKTSCVCNQFSHRGKQMNDSLDEIIRDVALMKLIGRAMYEMDLDREEQRTCAIGLEIVSSRISNNAMQLYQN